MEWRGLDGLINDFESMVRAAYGGLPTAFTGLDWKNVWAKATQIRGGFQNVRYPTREERQKAWERFHSLREEASRISHQQRENRRLVSEDRRRLVINHAGFAKPTSLFGLLPPDAEEMRGLGRLLAEARQMLREFDAEMLPEHTRECRAFIREIQEEHDAWWERYREARHERQAERRDRVRDNLEQNYERYRKAMNALERCRERVEELRSQIASAWSADWAARAEAWLAETEERCADIEASVRRIEGWIREGEAKLR